jgi:hypothetical protein
MHPGGRGILKWSFAGRKSSVAGPDASHEVKALKTRIGWSALMYLKTRQPLSETSGRKHGDIKTEVFLLPVLTDTKHKH